MQFRQLDSVHFAQAAVLIRRRSPCRCCELAARLLAPGPAFDVRVGASDRSIKPATVIPEPARSDGSNVSVSEMSEDDNETHSGMPPLSIIDLPDDLLARIFALLPFRKR